jgi:diguanylate cyclase (GGDEF)-like protein
MILSLLKIENTIVETESRAVLAAAEMLFHDVAHDLGLNVLLSQAGQGVSFVMDSVRYVAPFSLSVVFLFLTLTGVLAWAGFRNCRLRREVTRKAKTISHVVVGRERAEEALRESADLFSTFMRNIPALAFIKDGNGKYIYTNVPNSDFFGEHVREFMNKTDDEIWPGATAVGMKENDQLVLQEGRALAYLTRHVHSSRTQYFFVSKFPILRCGKPSAIGGIALDVTAQKQAVAQLNRDLLTDLPNGVFFKERLNTLLKSDKSGKSGKDASCAVLYLDIDHYKLVNVGLGHETGDTLLCLMGERFVTLAGEKALVARMGGDEFAFLLQAGACREEAVRLAEELLECVINPFQIGDQSIHSTVSIGVVMNDAGYENADQVLRDAQTAMYRAKDNGGGSYQLFQLQMRTQVVHRTRVASELRKAIEQGEFVLHYQPIMDLETEKLYGLEALIRWNHPERGLLGPQEFIQVAEETGLIVPMGQWVLEEACRLAKEVGTGSENGTSPCISVNLSVLQLIRGDLPSVLEGILRETGVDPRRLKLEITETLLMENAFSVIPVMERLRVLGVKLAIDDFGTGYSSLSYLNSLPLDMLKIDRMFVKELTTQDPRSARIVRTILNLARSLGMSVVAEGVETFDQCSVLRSLRCPLVQGYFFGKPMAGEQALALARTKLSDA